MRGFVCEAWIVPVLAVAVALSVLGGALEAGELEDGIAAYKKKDYATALRLFRPLAEKGNADCQFYLGQWFFNSMHVPQDVRESMRWYRKAADQGDARGQCELAWMYASGSGVPKSFPEAKKWYLKVADQGYAIGLTSIGDMYRREGAHQDFAQAMKWYRKAADHGDSFGRFQVAKLYENGEGVPQNFAEAMKWYRKDADQGDPRAQGVLGELYDEGRLAPQDHVEAYKWYILAAAHGDSWLEDRRARVTARDEAAASLTREQVAEGQRRAIEWKPSGAPSRFREPLYSRRRDPFHLSEPTSATSAPFQVRPGRQPDDEDTPRRYTNLKKERRRSGQSRKRTRQHDDE